jgi:hypothetical protein
MTAARWHGIAPASAMRSGVGGCAVITYLPMGRDFFYLIAVMDGRNRWMKKIFIRRIWQSLK